MDKQLNILNVEGPAGAGKTTLIENLVNKGTGKFYIQVVPKGGENKTRDYRNTDNGATNSMVKDLAQYLWILRHAFNNPQLNETVYITDRWVISQFVYGNLRLENDFSAKDFDTYMRSNTSNLANLTTAWLTRNINIKGMIQLDVRVIPLYYTPAPVIIQARREKTEKEYPFSVEKEYFFYEGLINSVFEMGLDEHMIHIPDINIDIEELELSILHGMIKEPQQYDIFE